MELKCTYTAVFVLLYGIIALNSVSCRHRGQRSQRKHIHNNVSNTNAIPPLVKEDYGGASDSGRHAYLMDDERVEKSTHEKLDDDQTLSVAFEKHFGPPGKAFNNLHDVYAYKLPSDLWFIVRYTKNNNGEFEKYMNIVDGVATYLDKLGSDVKTVSVNVKGVETVFRLRTKPAPPADT